MVVSIVRFFRTIPGENFLHSGFREMAPPFVHRKYRGWSSRVNCMSSCKLCKIKNNLAPNAFEDNFKEGMRSTQSFHFCYQSRAVSNYELLNLEVITSWKE